MINRRINKAVESLAKAGLNRPGKGVLPKQNSTGKTKSIQKQIQGGPSTERMRRIYCKPPQRFRSNDKILEAAALLFKLREATDPQEAALAKHFSAHFHKCLKLSSVELSLIRVFNETALDHIEKEVLLLLTLSALGMHSRVSSFEEIQRAMDKTGKVALSVARVLDEDGRLVKAKLIKSESMMGTKKFWVYPILIKTIISSGDINKLGAKKYEDLLEEVCKVVKATAAKVKGINRVDRDNGLLKGDRLIDKSLNVIFEALRKHPDWPLYQLLRLSLSPKERFIMLMLAGKELGYVTAHDKSFTGAGLAKCAGRDTSDEKRCFALLKGDSRLRKKGYITPCNSNGKHGNSVETEAELRDCQFELTERCLRRFKIKQNCQNGDSVRQPMIKSEQLVLSESAKSALEMCVAQAKNAEVMFDKWGLSETFPYGTATTVLFFGPPGTGKTACAEAVAHRLNKPIMVVNSSDVLDKYVGESDKNIVKVFEEAKNVGAVLFWDEADALFYDRDSAFHNWEVRVVNILLQEMEKFKGVCILSTNRNLILDKALERRIAIKVQFERPNKKQRQQIWGKLVPKNMPLAEDVSVERLSEEDLSGGEIKNVVLNAARLSLCRGSDGPITMLDFEKALRMEREGSWTGNKNDFGFGAKKQKRI
jgi:SpoVK/Ycf46/Vps4 family AAA+-type ATPase